MWLRCDVGTIRGRMPERSFGRTIRYRRNKMGLSQTKLGELVGRSASSIRSWERDASTPNDPSVVAALSAILDLDERALFDKAGLTRPEHETSPTVEQALASLRDSMEKTEAASPEIEEPERPRTTEPDEPVPAKLFPDPILEDEPLSSRSPTSVTSPNVVVSPTPLPSGELNYVQDPVERQAYRVRAMATAVGVVILVIMFLWALGSTFDALGSWWDEFVGTLRL